MSPNLHWATYDLWLEFYIPSDLYPTTFSIFFISNYLLTYYSLACFWSFDYKRYSLLPVSMFVKRSVSKYRIILLMDSSLRVSRIGDQLGWTKEEILAGLQHFNKLYNRYPTALEIDAFEYLPSSRSIQRSFGGLVVLRKELIPESQANYTQGKYRTAIAKRTWDRAAKYEEEFYNFLTSQFKSIAIHEHKIMRPGNICSDFFVYLDEREGVIIDLFYAQDMFSLIGVINIKLKRYAPLPYKTYFVLVGNDRITSENISRKIKNRKIPLRSNIFIDTEKNFKLETILQLKTVSQFVRKK